MIPAEWRVKGGNLTVLARGLSVIIPVYNEEENVENLYLELKLVLDNLHEVRGLEYEMVFIDDGSSDRTIEKLVSVAGIAPQCHVAGIAPQCHVAGPDPRLRVIEFRRNFGQTAAMAAGLDSARYDTVVTMDGDLQNDPHEIPKLIDTLKQGYDLVSGWRKNRQDKWLSRKLPSKIANWVISKMTRVQLHDYGCTLKAMTGEVAKGIKLYGEMHRFIPALADEMGARIAEVPVNHRPRKFGRSKYGISRTFRVILDLITVKFLLGYSKRPIHLFGSLGLVSSFGGIVLLALLTYRRYAFHVPMGNSPLLALAVMLVIIGLQFLVFGLLGEVLARTYYESQSKKTYVIRKIHSSIFTPRPPEGAIVHSSPIASQTTSLEAWGRKAVG